MRLHHVVEAQDFNRGMLEELFSTARTMEKIVEEGGSKLLDGCIMASLFYEESTRTRFSFETAMLRLGGSVLSFLAAGIGLVWSLVDEDRLTWQDHISSTFPTIPAGD